MTNFTRMKRYFFLSVVLLIAMQLVAEPAQMQRVINVMHNGKQVLEAKQAGLPVLGVYDSRRSIEQSSEMASFMSYYEEAVRRIEAGEDMDNVFIRINRSAATADSVGPLLGNIKYDQGEPYNRKCPVLNNEGRSVTGCVATAMAQVMRFYQHPSCGTGTSSYTGSSGAVTYDFSKHPFNWNLILEDYSSQSYTNAQAEAVAELMLACGASVNMKYSADGSGSNADKAALALKNNFDYPTAANLELYVSNEDIRQNILVEVWGEALRMNIDAGHPVIYAGSSGNAITGHCFVVDGYKFDADGNTYFHINWGWSGANDGWFLITGFQPTPDETNYSYYRNSMVYDIYPPTGTDLENVSSNKLDLTMPVYNILGQQVNVSQLQKGMIYIQKGRKFVW